VADFQVATAYADFSVKNVDAGIDAAIARLKERSGDFDIKAQVAVDADTTLAKVRIKELSDQKNATSIAVGADTALAKAKIAELSAKQNAAIVSVDADITKAQARIDALIARKDKNPKLDVDADISKAQAKLDALSAKKVRIQAEIDDSSLAKTTDKIVSETDKAAKRANASFSAMTFAGLSLGLPAAAAAGVAGTGLALAAVPLMLGGLGASFAMANDDVARSFDDLGNNVVGSIDFMSQAMDGPLQASAGKLNGTFNSLKPQIQAAMNDSAGAVGTLTDGVDNLAINAMPGLARAANAQDGPMQGLKALLGEVGTGTSEMFTNMTAGSQSAGAGLTTLGGIIRDAMGFIGTFFAQLSNGSAGPLNQLSAMLNQAEQALLHLTSTGSGALGFLTGFTSGATGMLSVVNLISQGISLLPPQVTQFAGSFTASAMVLDHFGISAKGAFDGLGTKISAANGPAATLGGLASAALSPAMLATAGLGLAMDILGQKEKDAAANAQAQTQRIQSLAAALRESNGAIDDNVRASAAQALSNFTVSDGQRNLLEDARNLGVGIPTVTNAYLGNADAQKTMVASLQKTVDAHKSVADSFGLLEAPFSDNIRVLNGTAYAYDDTGLKAQQLLDIVSQSGGTFAGAVQTNKDLATATSSGVAPTTELGAAMGQLRSTAGNTADRVTALKTALDVLSGRTPIFEDAVKSGNDALRGMLDGLKNGATAAEGMGKALLNADGTINTVTKNGSGLQGLAEGLQTSFTDAASGIKQMTDRGIPFATATKTVNDALQTQRDSFIQVAEKMGISASAAGALADKYGLIPKTITTDVNANVKQAQAAIDALPKYAAGVSGAVVMSADTNPATHNIDATIKYADGSTGVISIDGHYDKATGKVMAAVQYADGQTGTLTIDAAIAAAQAGTLQAVRFANGQTGFISVQAKADAANAAIDNAARNRTATIQVQYQGQDAKLNALAAQGRAQGGLVGPGLPRFATGGSIAQLAMDVSAGGRVSGAGTPTSDSNLALLSDTEMVINARDTARNLGELAAINAGMRNYQQYPDTGRPPMSNPYAAPAAAPTINITINPPPGASAGDTAAMVGAAVGWELKNGG
jgi:hypothetical protein